MGCLKNAQMLWTGVHKLLAIQRIYANLIILKKEEIILKLRCVNVFLFLFKNFHLLLLAQCF